MVVTVTPNPAWDVTYRVPALLPGDVHRVEVAARRAGGKGLNTAGVLVAMGVPAAAVAPVGRDALADVARDLDARGVAHRLVEVPTAIRRSVAVVDDAGEATVLNEAGEPLRAEDLDRLVRAAGGLVGPGDVVAVSGSLPPGAPAALVADLVTAAHAAGARVVLDVRGPGLLAALPGGPDLVTPNRREAADALGRPDDDAVALARGLVARGARSAVVTDGTDGLVAVHGTTELRARPGEVVRGNATGAGDAVTAALAAALHDVGDLPEGPGAWAEVLRRAVAWSAAAVLQPVAGQVDPADVRRLEPLVRVDPVDGPPRRD